MKCKLNNSCKWNPKRHNDYQSRSRNYSRQPVMDYEHGECPFRVDGRCTNPKLISAHIGDLRIRVTARKKFAEWKVGKYELKYFENSDYFKTFKEYFGGRFVSNRDENREQRYFYEPDKEMSGLSDFMSLKEYLERSLDYLIKEYLENRVFAVDRLFTKFISFKIWNNEEITLIGDAKDFDVTGLEIVDGYYEKKINTKKYTVKIYLEVRNV